MDKPLTIVVAYRSACAREMIAITDKRLGKNQPYKSSSFPALQSPSSAKGLTTDAAGKEGSSETQAPIRRLSAAKVEEYRKKNLCFKCECKNKSLMLIECDDMEELAE